MCRTFNAISLFSGAGGMDVGFVAAGVNVVVANEIVKDAANTYMANHPNCLMINDDINNIKEDFGKQEKIDIVFGGPPCQGFSVAGKMNPEDDRSKLIFSFLDVVEIVKPKAFVMENVKALAKLNKWKDVRNKFLDRAQKLGYTCYPYVLNASEYGVSQKRERVFFIGIQGDLFFYNEIEQNIVMQKAKPLTVKELLTPLGKAGSDKNPNTCTAKITFATNPVMRRSPYAGMYFNGQGRPIDINGYANTLPASMGGNKTPFIDESYMYGEAEDNWIADYHKALIDGVIVPEFKEAPKRLRRITINEAARIQSFPEEYIFCGNKAAVYTQIGNAVPCKLAEVVASGLVKYLHKKEEEGC